MNINLNKKMETIIKNEIDLFLKGHKGRKLFCSKINDVGESHEDYEIILKFHFSQNDPRLQWHFNRLYENIKKTSNFYISLKKFNLNYKKGIAVLNIDCYDKI